MSIHLLQSLHRHHLDRVAHRKFEREIAGYRTEADRLDLQTILDRYQDEQTLEIRQILAAHAA